MRIDINHVVRPVAGVPCFLVLTPDRVRCLDLGCVADYFGHTVTCMGICDQQFEKIEATSQTLRAQIAVEGIKRITLMALPECYTLAIALALAEPKLVRRLVLVNPEVTKSSLLSRVLLRLERLLPLGLPFRKISDGYDASPYLHRLSLPTLVVCGSDATRCQLSQAQMIVERVPSSWLVRLECSLANLECLKDEEMNSMLGCFLEVPAKRPQKKLARP